MKIKLNNVRLSFPSIWRKSVYNGEETKFEATFLIDKKGGIVKKFVGAPDFAALHGLIEDLLKEA